MIDFPEHTVPNDHPGAMAYARPYEGVHIVVLYDRMQKVQGRLRPVLLGHVLAHELTHVLLGADDAVKYGADQDVGFFQGDPNCLVEIFGDRSWSSGAPSSRHEKE